MVKTKKKKGMSHTEMKKILDSVLPIYYEKKSKEFENELKNVEREIKFWDNKEITKEEIMSGELFENNRLIQSLFERRDYLKECLKECKN